MNTEQLFKAIVASVCAYESIAITSGKLPTITSVVHRHPVVGLVVVAGLSHHFQTRPQPEV